MSTVASGPTIKRKLGSEVSCRARPKQPKRRCRVPKIKSEVSDIEDVGSLDRVSARTALLEWYDKHHRQLPWRRSPKAPAVDLQSHAYAVWVSEVMLQQTQVVKVKDYFDRWMERWPTVRSLAAAELEDVRELWAGLGYYSRAKHLLNGARYILDRFDGEFPSSINELQSIPGEAGGLSLGVGDYTSRAIASIVFDKQEAVVDGNVIRVLARLFATRSDPKKHRRLFQLLADAMLDPLRPGDFNQAMMELGAVICRPSNPQCIQCPVQPVCSAYKQAASVDHEAASDVTDYPVVVKKPAKKEVNVAVYLLQMTTSSESTERWTLMLKRPSRGLLAGLWEFPTVEIRSDSIEDPAALRNGYLESISSLVIRDVTQLERTHLGSVVHVFTHIRMTLDVELLVVKGHPQHITFSDNVEYKWLVKQELETVGLCSMVKKVYALLTKHGEA